MSGLSEGRRVLANRSVLAAELAFGGFAMVLHGAWIVVMLWAFERGGVGAAGLTSMIILGPAALSGPFVSVFFDRFSPRVALAAGYSLQGLGLVAAALAVGVSAPAPVVYGSLILFAMAQMSSRPAMSSILPRVVRHPAELAAANSLTELIDTVGLIAGPFLAGLVLFLVGDLSVAFAVAGATMFVAAAVASTVNTADRPGETPTGAGSKPETGRSGPAEVIRDVAAGAKLLAREAAPRQLVLVVVAIKLIVGTLEVAVVPIAIDQLGRGEATVGLLTSAIGAGGIAGAMASFLLVGRRRLLWPITLGLIAASLPLVAVPATNGVLTVGALMFVLGFGRPVVGVGVRSLLQGLSADDTLARIFGFLEGASLLSVALGSGIFALLAVATGTGTALMVLGVVPLVVLAAVFAGIRASERARPEVDPALLAMVREVSIFAPLAPFRIEQILPNLQRTHVAEAGGRIMTKGDPGDRFHLIESGSVIVEVGQNDVPLAAGDYFGEIALLQDQPRSATVRAGPEGVSLLSLDRTTFLDAIGSSPRSGGVTRDVAARRIAEHPVEHASEDPIED